MRVVVLGGAGNFGARIVRALSAESGVEVVAAGRRATTVPGAPEVSTAALDIAANDFAARLKDLAPDLVIHCVGPFQGQDYRVAHSSLAAGAHYLDLADGRDFVAGFPAAVNAVATHHGRTAISGASTLPGLSTAVVDALAVGLSRIDSIQTVIAPGQRAARGVATLAAVLSYLGRPVSVWRDGRWQKAWGWMDLKRFRLGFGSRWGALCDVPDLALLPMRYPQLQTVVFHAALEVGAQQVVLWLLAGLRRLGLPLPVVKWAGVMDLAASRFDRFAGKWGGMQVQITGVTATGAHVRRTWSLQAPALHGPEIPCMTAILLARRMARGQPISPGAFTCMGFLTLDDFAPLFEQWNITTQAGEQLM